MVVARQQNTKRQQKKIEEKAFQWSLNLMPRNQIQQMYTFREQI